MPAEGKFIVMDGILRDNPAYGLHEESRTHTPDVFSKESMPLAVISSRADGVLASKIQEAVVETPIELTKNIQSLFKTLDGVDWGGQEAVDSPVPLVTELDKAMSQQRIPIGVLEHLFSIRERSLHFMIDDRGSMKKCTDVELTEATTYVRGTRHTVDGLLMTRWEETQDRLHRIIDLIAYIPTNKPIYLTFLNAKEYITLERVGYNSEQFRQAAHRVIIDTFKRVVPCNKTSVLTALEEAFSMKEPCLHYLFADGSPNDCSLEQLNSCLSNRPYPFQHALTFIGCSSLEEDVSWMTLLANQNAWVSVMDDFKNEQTNVLFKQGVGLPYTQGLWIVCLLSAVLHPNDLGSLNQNLPLTKATLELMLGRVLRPNEYQFYFEQHPSAFLYVEEYPRFLNEVCIARDIISKSVQMGREEAGGFVNGGAPALRPSRETIAKQIMCHTRWATSDIESQVRCTRDSKLNKRLAFVSSMHPPCLREACEHEFDCSVIP